MPGRYRLSLSAEQVRELEQMRDHDPTPHLREKAAALLKVHAGQAIRQVAQQGLLRPRRPHTVKAWISRYLRQGRAGLVVQAGRGRHRLFFPPQPGSSQAVHRTGHRPSTPG